MLKVFLKDGTEKATEILELIHHLLVESPGGAQWYTYSCIWMLLILLLFCRKEKYELILFGVFLFSYLFGSVFMLDYFKQFQFRVWYDMVFFSDRNIFHFGIYFMLGYVIAMINKTGEFGKLHKFLLFAVLLIYIFFGLFLYNRSSIVLTFVFSCLKLIGVYCLFELTLHIQWITFDTVILRKMSTAIYFTHYTLVYVFVAMAPVINNNVITSLLCTLCSVIVAYIITNGWNGEIYKLLF